jgi:hypothetical protein
VQWNGINQPLFVGAVPMPVWRHIAVPQAGYAEAMSEAIVRAGEKIPDLLWSVNEGLQVVTSDYSGQHKGATHEAYSFLVATWDALQHWLPQRAEFRAQWLPDGRRLSFKQLREPVRRRAYPHFLRFAGQLQGNLITFMIDRRVQTFVAGGPSALAAALPDCFARGTPLGSVEKMYRLALFVTMIQAGLREEKQKSVWISDHDETLDTFERREGFARLSTYLGFGLTGWREAAEQTFMTTEGSNLPEWAEDLAAIADIAAGACASLSNHLPTFLGTPTWTIGMRSGDEVDWRAREFMDWLSALDGHLRHVLVRLGPNSSGDIQASAQSFLRSGG